MIISDDNKIFIILKKNFFSAPQRYSVYLNIYLFAHIHVLNFCGIHVADL